MSQDAIRPEHVTRPYQLLAASFVALILIDSAFLGAARFLTQPPWIPALLAIASVCNVPLFLAAAIVLQTKYRPELQDDTYYSDYIKRRDEMKSLAHDLQATLKEAGVDPQDIMIGKSMTGVLSPRVGELLRELEAAVANVTQEAVKVGEPPTVADAAYDLAVGYMAAGEWHRAAEKYADFIRAHPDDWEAHFERGLALANTRQGFNADLAALREYNEAIALAGDSLEQNRRAKLHTYRGAILKRLERLDEAELELIFGRGLATVDDVLIDNAYNLAAVYAMKGDREKMLANIRRLGGAPAYLALVTTHLRDYFRRFASDRELLSLLSTAHIS